MDVLNQKNEQTALLISVDTGEFDAQMSLDELAALADTAGAEVYGFVTQKRDIPDKSTCIGSGRLKEVAEICQNAEISLLIFDCELSATQLRNIEKETNCHVVDRTMLILDIFAKRARSSEGRIQVELAQLQYLLPRLAGRGNQLSRLGGGIGTRGPGETKLETDRRHIRRRIQSLREQLAKVERRRENLRVRRHKDNINTVALVGYTNAGKSTLMNKLTDAGVLVENKLFATLDPTSRALKLPDGRQVLLIDTVGFISRLPHHLVEAFRSTLEEAIDADVILNICDSSNPNAEDHLNITISLLNQLGCKNKPIIQVLNKYDIQKDEAISDFTGKTVKISALTGEGIKELVNVIAEALPPDRRRVTLIFPYSKGGLAEQCRQEGYVEKDEYTSKGIKMTVILNLRLLELCKEYIID